MSKPIGSSPIQALWTWFSKERLVTPGNVVLAAAVVFGVYKLYRIYQALAGRVDQLDGNLIAANQKSSELEKEQGVQKTKIDQLDAELIVVKQRIVDQLKVPKAVVPPLTFNTLHKSSEKDDDDDDKFATPTEESPRDSSTDGAGDPTKTLASSDVGIPVSSPHPVDRVGEPAKTPEQLFKDNFPGKNLKCSYEVDGKTVETTLSDYLMATFFRIKELKTCTYNEGDHSFTLIYQDIYKFVVSKLPQGVWDKMSMWMKLPIAALLVYKPEIRIGAEIKGRFVHEENGVRIEVNPEAFAMTPIATQIPLLGYEINITGHCKSVHIPNNPAEKLFIESEHTVPQITLKGGSLPYKEVVQVTSDFFPHESSC